MGNIQPKFNNRYRFTSSRTGNYYYKYVESTGYRTRQLRRDMKLLCRATPVIQGEEKYLDREEIEAALVQLRLLATLHDIDFQKALDCFKLFVTYGTFTHTIHSVASYEMMEDIVLNFAEYLRCYNVIPATEYNLTGDYDPLIPVSTNIIRYEYGGHYVYVPACIRDACKHGRQIIEDYLHRRRRDSKVRLATCH